MNTKTIDATTVPHGKRTRRIPDGGTLTQRTCYQLRWGRSAPAGTTIEELEAATRYVAGAYGTLAFFALPFLVALVRAAITVLGS